MVLVVVCQLTPKFECSGGHEASGIPNLIGFLMGRKFQWRRKSCEAVEQCNRPNKCCACQFMKATHISLSVKGNMEWWTLLSKLSIALHVSICVTSSDAPCYVPNQTPKLLKDKSIISRDHKKKERDLSWDHCIWTKTNGLMMMYRNWH